MYWLIFQRNVKLVLSFKFPLHPTANHMQWWHHSRWAVVWPLPNLHDLVSFNSITEKKCAWSEIAYLWEYCCKIVSVCVCVTCTCQLAKKPKIIYHTVFLLAARQRGESLFQLPINSLACPFINLWLIAIFHCTSYKITIKFWSLIHQNLIIFYPNYCHCGCVWDCVYSYQIGLRLWPTDYLPHLKSIVPIIIDALNCISERICIII